MKEYTFDFKEFYNSFIITNKRKPRKKQNIHWNKIHKNFKIILK